MHVAMLCTYIWSIVIPWYNISLRICWLHTSIAMYIATYILASYVG